VIQRINDALGTFQVGSYDSECDRAQPNPPLGGRFIER
jgi:hypothetical protein